MQSMQYLWPPDTFVPVLNSAEFLMVGPIRGVSMRRVVTLCIDAVWDLALQL